MTLPRPLKDGEFFCHACQEFFLLADHDAHQRFHLARAK